MIFACDFLSFCDFSVPFFVISWKVYEEKINDPALELGYDVSWRTRVISFSIDIVFCSHFRGTLLFGPEMVFEINFTYCVFI